MERLNIYLDENVKSEKAILDYIGTSKKKTTNLKYLLNIGLYALQGNNNSFASPIIPKEEDKILKVDECEELELDEISDDIMI